METPIYLLAKHYFYQQGINFDITQVIGLTNQDPVIVPQLINLPNMPARWAKLIQLAQQHILHQQLKSA